MRASSRATFSSPISQVWERRTPSRLLTHRPSTPFPLGPRRPLIVAKGDRTARLHFLRLPMVRLNSRRASCLQGRAVQITQQFTLQPALHAQSPVSAPRSQSSLGSVMWFNERGRAVKQWAFPRIDPHTVNDMRINYAQGSRQGELATVDGAEKRGEFGVGRGARGGSITRQHSQCHRGIVS